MDNPWAPGRWPWAVRTGWVDYSPELNLSQLDAVEKRVVWSCLQRRRPRLAAQLQSEAVRVLRETFGADIILKIDGLTGEETHVDFDAQGG